jgi:hypothetical protein
MHARPETRPVSRDAVRQVLSGRTRYALRRAAAVDRLRRFDMTDYRTPFSWMTLLRYLFKPSVLLFVILPTAGSVTQLRGTPAAIAELGVMLVCAALGLASLRGGAWTYRETCTAAYWGTLEELTTGAWSAGLKARSQTVPDLPEWVRVRDALRWGRWASLGVLALTVWLGFAVSATVLDSLWEAGWVSTLQPMSAFTVTGRVYEEVLWTLANSIPVLNLPDALHWADPSPFRDNLLTDVTLLAARVAVFGPVIGWMIAAYRGAGFDPRQPAVADKVSSRVVRGVNCFIARDHSIAVNPVPRPGAADTRIMDQLLRSGPDEQWQYAVTFATLSLQVELGEPWIPELVLAYLAAQNPDDIGKEQEPTAPEPGPADAGSSRASGRLPAAPPPEGGIPVFIYLDTDDEEAAGRVVRAVDNLVDVLGYEGPISPVTERGSFIRRSWARIKGAPASRELRDEALRAAALYSLDSRQAAVDNAASNAVAQVITSLSTVASAAVHVGSLLIIKVTEPDGQVVTVKNLTAQEIWTLRERSGILREPRKVLELLALAVADFNQLEP